MQGNILRIFCAGALALAVSTGHAAEQAKAEFLDTEGNKVGTAELKAGPTGTLITLDIDGLAAGTHAIHMHGTGTCEDHNAGFKDSGGHINPGDKQHGLLNPKGPDAGDLPNFRVAEDGNAWAQMFTSRASLDGANGAKILDEDGTALVIHANRDDFKSQPIGGAGDRIACGVIKAK